MSAKEARSVVVGFSTNQLDDAGITDDLGDSALMDIVDNFLLTFSNEFREEVQLWIEDHEDDDLQGQFDVERAGPLR